MAITVSMSLRCSTFHPGFNGNTHVPKLNAILSVQFYQEHRASDNQPICLTQSVIQSSYEETIMYIMLYQTDVFHATALNLRTPQTASSAINVLKIGRLTLLRISQDDKTQKYK